MLIQSPSPLTQLFLISFLSIFFFILFFFVLLFIHFNFLTPCFVPSSSFNSFSCTCTSLFSPVLAIPSRCHPFFLFVSLAIFFVFFFFFFPSTFLFDLIIILSLIRVLRYFFQTLYDQINFFVVGIDKDAEE